jgi:hypothetical protein
MRKRIIAQYERSRNRICVLEVGFILLACVLIAFPALAQDQTFKDCKGVLFSTEEDFRTRGPEPFDGNPIISDGDLLARSPLGNVLVCARNRDLIRNFDVNEDMGLDAVDAIDSERGVIAFSTELDSPHGNFTDGDILFPDGTVIPNIVLVHRFQLRDNVGLDAVHFVGGRDEILRVIAMARKIGPEGLKKDPQQLTDLMRELKVDIWFSIEGTGPTAEAPSVLDGDLLSAATGSKVAPNGVLLFAPIPAGVPNRGVDFGLDAVTTDRAGNRERINFSTEILYRGERQSFNDGDVLKIGGAVVITNADLIRALKPAADFVGLDALSIGPLDTANRPHIDTLCGDGFDAADFNNLGLWQEGFATAPPGSPPRRPCGMFVPIHGTLPATGITRFRIAYRLAGTPPPAIGTGNGIVTKWRMRAPHPITGLCSSSAVATVPLETTADGWMDVQDYTDAMIGNPLGITGDGIIGCANGGLRMAVWDTLSLPAAQQNEHFVVWLEWETSGGALAREAREYHIQLDNKAPEIAPYPNGLQVKLADGSGELVPACGQAPSEASEFEVWAQFADPYYWYFTLTVEGGNPPTSHTFRRVPGDISHEYFEAHDGPPGLKNTDDTGTMPDLATVHLRNIDMTALGSSFNRCCYLLRLWVYDAAILHTFNGLYANLRIPHRSPAITTFEAGN